MSTSSRTKDILKRSLQVVVFVLILAAILFVPAGSLDWVMAWVFIGTYLGTTVVGVSVVAKASPELIEERRQVKEGTKMWDRILTNLFSLVSVPVVLIVAGLDYRFEWSPRIPLALQIIALVVEILAYGLVFWAMMPNQFFATYVRIQKDRGHSVISDGPYRFVRHPGYVGMITSALAIPLMLGSLWAFIPAGLGACIVIVRTALEDRTLQEELDGYRDYVGQVRYRLLPGVW
ncbi:MAG: isoprenylcysteine carboxylmethyltransferase family protein [Chloroflexi bacterium]|nr:isoprenylcysteine carboxylmethyltransferase family protein [Chloroflexota bacterium]